MVDIHAQLLALTAENHKALVQSLEQIVFNISTLDLLRRDAILSAADRRIPTRFIHETRASPFFNGKDMFQERTMGEARKELDRRRAHDYGSHHRGRDFDVNELVSAQWDGGRDPPPSKASEQHREHRSGDKPHLSKKHHKTSDKCLDPRQGTKK